MGVEALFNWWGGGSWVIHHSYPPLSRLPQLSPGGIHYQVEEMMVMEKKMNALPLLFCMISADRFLMMVS